MSGCNKKIALFGHRIDSSNLGVDALTRSHLAMISSLAVELDLKIEVDIYAGQQDLTTVYDLKNVQVRQFAHPISPKCIVSNVFNIPRYFKKYLAVFDLSEGDSFADIYGWRRAYINSFQRVLAARAGCPVVVAPMTIGPFKHWFWRWFAATALRRCALVFARDEKSVLVARGLGCDSVQLATDLAMALPYERSKYKSEGEDSLHVGVNISGLLWSGGYTGKNQFGIHADYQATVIAIIERLLSEPNIQVHLVPHVLSVESVEDDRLASQEIQARFPVCLIAPQFSDAIEAKSYISGLDLFLGSRMHACIAAFSSGVPTLPLAYSMKFEGLFGSLGYTRTVDLCSDSEADVLNSVNSIMEDLSGTKRDVEQSMLLAHRRLLHYRESISEMIKSL